MCSAYNSSNTLPAPYQIMLTQTLSQHEQQTITSLLRLLPADCIDDIQLNSDATKNIATLNVKRPNVYIQGMVDGRGLACPMPLLKTKVALRNVAIGESLYVVATDPNSQADITAFCQQAKRQSQASEDDYLLLTINQTTHKDTYKSSELPSANITTIASTDTIYHFIITKTDSN